ncbi:hypothetical protein BJ742DRAFT_770381 [Cladochytrium replicatum]|nr:hypothetical protein BJ742DRAFT_770381 [Cladochytrium replicatum]
MKAKEREEAHEKDSNKTLRRRKAQSSSGESVQRDDANSPSNFVDEIHYNGNLNWNQSGLIFLVDRNRSTYYAGTLVAEHVFCNSVGTEACAADVWKISGFSVQHVPPITIEEPILSWRGSARVLHAYYSSQSKTQFACTSPGS